MNTENRIDDDEKVIIRKNFTDVFGIGKVAESICLFGILVGIPMMCALTCSGKWDAFFSIFHK